MKRNKKYIVISAAIGAGVLLLGAVLIIGFAVRRNSAADGTVTRSEWLAMLGERFGIEDWGFMDEADRADSERAATGEFLVLTAMQTIGKYKIQLYLEMDEEPDRTDYLNVAYANDLITEDRLNAVFDREECSIFLDAVQNLNDLLLWKDDFVQYTCQENVVELKAGNVSDYQEESGEVWLDASAMEGLSAGDVIIFEMGNTGLKTAGRIESMDASSGLVTLSTPAMEEVFDSLIISDIVSFSGEDIADHYHFGNEYFGTYEDALSSTGSREDYKVLPVGTVSGSVQDAGMAFSVASEGDKITITVTNNNTGNSWKTEIPADLKDDAQIECSFEITNIDVAAQAIWRWSTLEYAEIRLYTEIVEIVNLNIVSEEIKIPLGEIPIPIAYGLASVNLQLSLVISAEGGISIETRTPVGTHLCYEKERGVRRVPMELNYSEPKIEASVEVGIALHPEATLKILVLWDAVDIGLDVGVTAGASASIHPTQTCTEIFIAFPVVSLKVTVDPIVIASLSAEWDIIAKEDAPFQWNKHYEAYRDGTSDFVEACTYGEQREEESANIPADAASDDSGTLPTDGDRIVLTGTVGTYDYDGIIVLQGQPDPNGGSEYAKSRTYRVIVLDAPQTLSLIGGDGSSYYSKEALMICIDYADGMDRYEGLHITFSIDPAKTYWPSDTSLPLGQPATTDVHILESSPDASLDTDDLEPMKTIEELWAKLDGIWVFEEYTYNGKTVNYSEHTLEFGYTDDIPCMHKDVHSDPDVLFYEISVVDAEHYDVYYYKKGSYNGREHSNWGSDTLACWYSIDLTDLSNGELILSPHMTFSNGFTDNYSVFRYRLEDGT